MPINVKIRNPTDEDTSFVYSSFLRTVRNAPYTYGISNYKFFRMFEKFLEWRIKSGTLKIAGIEGEEPDSKGRLPILGWILVHPPGCVDFVFVKDTYVGNHIGMTLFESVKEMSALDSQLFPTVSGQIYLRKSGIVCPWDIKTYNALLKLWNDKANGKA